MGRVSISADGEALGAAAVFLERLDDGAPGDALAAVVVGQRRDGFEPGFTVTAVGQPVLFVNRDEIFQAVFSYSEPNAFECRAFAPGETCLVTFRERGLVRTYSPLDADLRGAVLVVPAHHYGTPDARGEFRIERVPPGRYRVSVWTERHGGASRALALTPGATVRADFALRPPR